MLSQVKIRGTVYLEGGGWLPIEGAQLERDRGDDAAESVAVTSSNEVSEYAPEAYLHSVLSALFTYTPLWLRSCCADASSGCRA